MIVVDASAALQLALRGSLDRLGSKSAVAPVLLRSEAASALRQLAWRGDLTDDEARGALAELETAAIQLVTDAALAEEAYAVARRLGWAKTYDAEYVALAQRRGCPLLTVDARLARTARRVVEVLPPDAL